ncbi:MAG: hypothetical protein PVJ76_05765 [Gemmatimonadota bacterium]|jgi:hypothetical protein
MRKLASCSVLVLTTCLMMAQPLEGQKRGPGGIIDWIHRLSGPSMLALGGSYSWEIEEGGTRVRVGAVLGFPVARKDRIGDDQKLNMFSLQPSAEFPIFNSPVEVKTGLNIHRFGGTGHDPVWHLSVPLYLQLRLAVDSDQNLFLRIAPGFQYFPAFGYFDFDREIEVNRDGGEWTFAIQAGLDFMK